MGKIEDHARKLLSQRVDRMCRLFDMGAPDALLAAEADLIGDAGVLLDPRGHIERKTQEALVNARILLGLCLEPDCDAELEGDAVIMGRLCAAHSSSHSETDS